jgi:hypothetical protein
MILCSISPTIDYTPALLCCQTLNTKHYVGETLISFDLLQDMEDSV